MYLLFKCCTPEYVDDPTHALVEMTPGLATYIWDRIQLAKKLKAEDEDFLGLKYRDYSPEFMDFDREKELEEVCRMLSKPGDEYTEEDFDSDQDGGFIILPQRFLVHDPTGMRPVTLHVRDDGFYWTAYHKHGGMESRVETHVCTEKDLREMMEKLQ